MVLLSPGSLNGHHHDDLSRRGMVVLDALEVGEGSVSRVMLPHEELLSPVPCQEHLGDLVVDLVLKKSMHWCRWSACTQRSALS